MALGALLVRDFQRPYQPPKAKRVPSARAHFAGSNASGIYPPPFDHRAHTRPTSPNKNLAALGFSPLAEAQPTAEQAD